MQLPVGVITQPFRHQTGRGQARWKRRDCTEAQTRSRDSRNGGKAERMMDGAAGLDAFAAGAAQALLYSCSPTPRSPNPRLGLLSTPPSTGRRPPVETPSLKSTLCVHIGTSGARTLEEIYIPKPPLLCTIHLLENIITS